jgi:hypothetical protein
VAEAPFPARPDTVEPGDLLGPFDGRVLEAATAKPIQGAVVYAAWGFQIGRGLVAPTGGASFSTETDADGRYRIPRLAKVAGLRSRVERFSLVVYKPGFVAFRSDRRFEDLSLRRDFSQHENLARLEPFSASSSHVHHVRFVGGSGALRRALAGEMVQASLELQAASGAPTATPEKTGPALDASGLLSEDELKAVTGYTGSFSIERLGDLPSSPSYDSKHFRAVDKAESFDAAYRVWKLGEEAAEARFSQLAKEVPGAKVASDLGDRSLRGSDGRILAAAALDRARGLVIELTCGVDLCRDEEQVVALTRRVFGRLARLGEPSAASPPPAGTEEAK